MKVKLAGCQVLDFTSSDGKTVKGTKLFVLAEDKNVVGFKPYDFFVGADRNDIVLIKLSDFIGKDIDLEVDLKGKPICISA